MRTSRRLGIYTGGSKKVIITLHGATNEKIIYSGKEAGSITLEASGEKTGIELKAGTYTFTGDISGYSKTVTIKEDSTIKVHPDGAVFWYGNGDSEDDTLYSKFGAGFDDNSGYRPNTASIGKNASFTYTPGTTNNKYTISYKYNGTGTGYQVCANTYLKKTLDTSGYSKLHVDGSMTGGGSWYTTNKLEFGFDVVDKVGKTPATLSAGSRLVFSQQGYVDPYGSMNNTITIDAIWLE